MKNENNKNTKNIEEDNSSLIMDKYHKIPSKDKIDNNSNSIEKNESILIKNNINKDNENSNYIKYLLNKVINFNKENSNKSLIFECPNKNCPFIPLIKYFEFTQSVATKCRLGHEYHLSLMNYFELTFNKMNDKYCNLCLKKNYSNIISTSEFYCIQ